MERLLMTLPCERGELFYTASGRRILLAHCEPEIQIYENSAPVPAPSGIDVRFYHAVVVLCTEPDCTRPVDARFLRTVEGFELAADIQRRDGVFERFHFHNLWPEELEKFKSTRTLSLQEPQERIRRLLTL